MSSPLCNICLHTRVSDFHVTCPLCLRMSDMEKALMHDIAYNHPSMWFAEFSKLVVDGALKVRLLEIASVVKQLTWEEE